MVKKIISFGFKHGSPPDIKPGVVMIDVRQMFRNPFRDRSLRHKRGTDIEVQRDIEQTPHFAEKYAHVKDTVTAPGIEVAFVGCHGGHHRSVYLVERLGKELGVAVEHRDIAR